MNKLPVVNVGFLGFGTVGKGAVEALLKCRADIRARFGVKIVVKTIADPLIKEKDTSRLKGINLSTDAHAVLDDPEIDIVVELIGGTGAAREFVIEALEKGKAVVTANKALLASHWNEIMELARKRGTEIKFEAAVGGVIPIIGALQNGLIADKIRGVYGVLNGTTNYMLTEMEKTGKGFDALLKEAQKKGYAEANPESDLSGEDAAYKIALLTLISGKDVSWQFVSHEGIRAVKPIDFLYAKSLGCTIKLVAVSELIKSKLDLFVRPMLVPLDHPLASIKGSLNKVVVRGERSGETVYEGRGAGGKPTGVAVASNIVDLAIDIATKERKDSLSPGGLNGYPLVEERRAEWYLRFIVDDKVGIIHDISGILAGGGINIKAVHQEEWKDKSHLPFVIVTEEASEAEIKKAKALLTKFQFLVEEPIVMPFLK